MTLSLILLVAIVLVGAVLYGEHRLYMRRRADGNGDIQNSDGASRLPAKRCVFSFHFFCTGCCRRLPPQKSPDRKSVV